MSKFMNGLNNDIPSPVEEGVVDSIKNFFGRNKAITVDTSAIKSNINSALQQITSLAKTSEFKKLAKGLYKVSSGSMEVYDEHYKTIGDLNNKRFSEIPIKAGQELHVNIGEIQFWKIFPNKDRLDRSPGAERGDLSPEGKEFDRIVNEFSKALDEKVKSDKYKISIEWLVDWDDNNYDIVFKFVPRNYIKNDGGIKESFSSVSDKEAVQEELFPILTGKELPVREMSDGKAGALALATTIGIAGLGCGVLAVIGKGIEKLFGSHKSSDSGTVSRNDIEKIKRLSQQFMDTQQINSSERRKVFGEAYGLLKKHFDPMYFKTKAIEQGTEWNDPADFYSGKINIIEFAFTQSEHQSLVGDDKIDSSLPNDEYWKEYDKLAKKWIADVTKAANAINKELSKKYNGKYRIFFEELDGGYWDYFGEGDGDEGAVVIVDVDMIDRMKSYIKNHAVEESFTEVATEAEPVEEVSFSTAGRAILGILSTLGISYGIKKFIDHKKSKIKEKPASGFNEDEFLNNNPVDTEEREAVYKGAIDIVKKIFGKHIQYVGSKNFDSNVFIGKAKPKANDIFVIDLCRIFDFIENPEIVKVFNTLDDEKEKQAFVKKEFPKWDKEIRKLLKKAQDEIQKKFGTKYELEFGSVRDWCVLCMIDTAYVTKLASASSTARESTEVIYEGWGIAFTRFAVKHNLPFANKLEDKIWEWSESTVNQLTNIPEFKEYILREAPKAYDEAYLRNNNLSINVNADMISEFEEEYEDSEAYHKVDKKNCCFCKKIGKFYVGVFGDKSHIHGVWLLMSDSKNKKIYAKALPAPEKELNKFKYQK